MWKHGLEGHDEHKLWLTKWCWFGSIYHVMHIHLPSPPPPIIGHYGAKVSLKLHYNFLQLNLYQTDLLFWYLSHHLTWHCSSISEDLLNFAAYERKIVFAVISEQSKAHNNNRNNFALICCKFLANLCKFSEILLQCHVKLWVNYRTNGSICLIFNQLYSWK